MSFVVISPAHNEEAHIEKTIESMIAQTVRPAQWIVVNDNSTDRTAEIVSQYAQRHPFIKLINVERPPGRHFGNKVGAFNRGLAALDERSYDFIGNLDTDISLEPDYFERILGEFSKDAELGIAGGMISSRIGSEFVCQNVALDSVAGAVQLFRRACFEAVGGYTPLPNGGIDTMAEIKARMEGWKVRTFPEITVLEHRQTGSATSRPLMSRVNEGRRLHALGYSFLFFFLRCVYRLKERPAIVGSVAALFGFLKSMVKREPIALPQRAVEYLRAEQRSKILRSFGLLPRSQAKA